VNVEKLLLPFWDHLGGAVLMGCAAVGKAVMGAKADRQPRKSSSTPLSRGHRQWSRPR
jgi:hypothetical protein